jgi:ankyrin repeat protein
MLRRIADGRTDLVFEYVAAGHPARSVDAEGVPLLRHCARYGDVSAMRFLLAQGEELGTLGANLGLGEAAFHGHWRLVEFLAEAGADVNLADPDTGETPLHAATSKANRPAYTRVVKVLLTRGANPNAAARPNIQTAAFMRDARTKGETSLHRAAAFGTEECIRLLLDAGARRDARDMNGDTPLSWASWHLRPDSILRALCYDGFAIHPTRGSASDHGQGWGALEVDLLGTPRV